MELQPYGLLPLWRRVFGIKLTKMVLSGMERPVGFGEGLRHEQDTAYLKTLVAHAWHIALVTKWLLALFLMVLK